MYFSLYDDTVNVSRSPQWIMVYPSKSVSLTRLIISQSKSQLTVSLWIREYFGGFEFKFKTKGESLYNDLYTKMVVAIGKLFVMFGYRHRHNIKFTLPGIASAGRRRRGFPPPPSPPWWRRCSSSSNPTRGRWRTTPRGQWRWNRDFFIFYEGIHTI